jgi:hypothetical protein
LDLLIHLPESGSAKFGHKSYSALGRTANNCDVLFIREHTLFLQSALIGTIQITAPVVDKESLQCGGGLFTQNMMIDGKAAMFAGRIS